jgi:hypothetical protein
MVASTSPTEIVPGSPAPGVQDPTSGNPQESLGGAAVVQCPMPFPRQRRALAPPPVPSPRIITTLRPPLGAPAGRINPGQGSLQLPQGQSPSQLNLIPSIAMPVLKRPGGPRSWVVPVNIAGQTNVTIRATYRDLRMAPGVRGILISYSSGGPVTIKCNWTGFQWILPEGVISASLPLFMLESMIDLTISAAIAFSANATCLLTSDEQIPQINEMGETPYPTGATPMLATATGAATGISTSLNPSAGRTSYLSGVQVTGLGATTGSIVTLGIAGLQGGTLTFYITVPTGATVPIVPLILGFNPALPANGPNTNIFTSLASFGTGNTVANLSTQGFQI